MEQGSCKAVRTGDGAEKVIDLKPGDYFGELALLNNEPRAASVTAEEDVGERPGAGPWRRAQLQCPALPSWQTPARAGVKRCGCCGSEAFRGEAARARPACLHAVARVVARVVARRDQPL